MSPLLAHSAVRLARMIREGEVTSLAVVDAHIARIRAVNPRINAVVRERFELAREEAKRADATASLAPFHGVPCTIKESFALEGMPNSAGLVARRDHVATSDATAVARLRAAGAIPLGVTNVSELCMWMESSNRVYGRTGNAFDHERIAGGSSGGEGAIVGAGGVPFGLGADIGGSIRMPAFFNGVFGHKPTGGLVPGTGQFPISENEALRYLTTGPIARRAEDLMPILRVLAGPDGVDTHCEARTLGSVEDVDVASLRVLDVADNGRIGVSRDMRAAQAKAARVLASRGATVVPSRIEGLRRSAEIWAAMMGTQETTSFRSRLEYGEKKHMGRELARWAVGTSDHTLPAIALALVEKITHASPKDTARFVAMGKALKDEVASRIGDGVMLYPSYPEVAPPHHAPLLFPVKWMYTAIFNVLELPVTQVPLGLDARGLPLGVQVVGAHGNDHLTIAVAMELERQFGGWASPLALR